MTFLTLFSDEQGWAASDQRVYDAGDIPALKSLLSQTEALSAAIAQQRADAVRAREEARAQGYAEGHAQGLQEQRDALLERVSALQEQHDRALENQQAACVELALDVVRKIAGEVTPARWLRAQAEHAASTLIDSPVPTLRVSPDQVDAVARALGADGESAISRVIGDAELGPDDCLLDTGAGTIDVSLDTQLAAIARLFGTDSAAGRSGDV